MTKAQKYDVLVSLLHKLEQEHVKQPEFLLRADEACVIDYCDGDFDNAFELGDNCGAWNVSESIRTILQEVDKLKLYINMKITLSKLRHLIRESIMGNEISLKEFSAVDKIAYMKALDIVSECGSPDDEPADRPTENQFVVHVHPNKYYNLVWREYGPFNPVPEWIWDPETHEWIDPEEDDDSAARFEELRNKIDRL